MSDTITCYVAGVTYTNNPAGTGGQEFKVNASGSRTDEIWYQVDRSIVREAIVGEDIRRGYLDAQGRSSLNQLSVTYKTREDVAGAGMGHYILWMKPTSH
jgi:hypothetical protein